MFNIGQEVECIREDWGCERMPKGWVGPPHLPKIGETFVICDIKKPGMFSRERVDHLYFNEIPGDHGFASNFFRPLQRRKTDISIFTAMLKTEKERV